MCPITISSHFTKYRFMIRAPSVIMMSVCAVCFSIFLWSPYFFLSAFVVSIPYVGRLAQETSSEHLCFSKATHAIFKADYFLFNLISDMLKLSATEKFISISYKVSEENIKWNSGICWFPNGASAEMCHYIFRYMGCHFGDMASYLMLRRRRILALWGNP